MCYDKWGDISEIDQSQQGGASEKQELNRALLPDWEERSCKMLYL